MFAITILPEITSLGVVAKGKRKYKESKAVYYEWEIEALDNGEYSLYINGDYEGIDFKSIKACKDYLKKL